MLKCQKCPWAENHRSWLCGREVGLWLLMRQVPVSRTDTHTDKLCDRSMLLLIILHLVTVSEVYALWGFSGGREDFNRGFNAAKLLSELSPFQRCCIPTGLTLFFFFFAGSLETDSLSASEYLSLPCKAIQHAVKPPPPRISPLPFSPSREAQWERLGDNTKF